MQNIAFWLSTNGLDPNRVWDARIRSYLYNRGPGYTVLNSLLDGFPEFVATVKDEFPQLKILRYAHGQHAHETDMVSGSWFPDCFNNRLDWCLKKASNRQPRVDGSCPNRVCWMDLTNSAYRAAAVTHFAEEIAKAGAHGIALDGCQTDIEPADFVDGAAKNRAWVSSFISFLRALRVAMPPGTLILFNGMWSHRDDNQILRQEQYLPYVDAAMVEYWTHSGARNQNFPDPYDTFVERIYPVVNNHPDKIFLFHGTTRGEVYFDYHDDMRNARYAYACFLVHAWAANRSITYGQNFGALRLPKERAGGLAVHGYLNMDLGEPLDEQVPNRTGGFSRVFKKGLVLLAPENRGTQVFTIPFRCWSPAGQNYRAGDSITLPDYDALILTQRRPEIPGHIAVHSDQHGTEWMVQYTTEEFRYKTLALTVSSNDIASAIFVRFETDNAPNIPFGKLTVCPVGGTFRANNLDYAYGQDGRLTAVRPSTKYLYALGTVNRLVLDLDTECSPYVPHRIISLRTLGNVSVSKIRLSHPVC